ncbi:hypothetical protein RSAG8_05873, partial [Rhizoctonia solani AG-8 WAC10335]
MTHRARSLRADPKLTKQETAACVEIAEPADELLVQIRELPGYQGFLEPDPLRNARGLAKYGHSEVRVSAVLGLNLEEARRMVRNMKGVLGQAGLSTRGVNPDSLDVIPAEESTERGFSTHARVPLLQYIANNLKSTLSTIWNAIDLIKEIFQLERNGNSKVYLYPTDPLSNLSIHAACNREESLLDYTSASYIPSLQHFAFLPCKTKPL